MKNTIDFQLNFRASGDRLDIKEIGFIAGVVEAPKGVLKAGSIFTLMPLVSTSTDHRINGFMTASKAEPSGYVSHMDPSVPPEEFLNDEIWDLHTEYDNGQVLLLPCNIPGSGADREVFSVLGRMATSGADLESDRVHVFRCPPTMDEVATRRGYLGEQKKPEWKHLIPDMEYSDNMSSSSRKPRSVSEIMSMPVWGFGREPHAAKPFSGSRSTNPNIHAVSPAL